MEIEDCPDCGTERFYCDCGMNATCRQCGHRLITFPCECPDGIPSRQEIEQESKDDLE